MITEEEYIIFTDLSKVDAARDILRNVVPEINPLIDKEEFREIMVGLHKLHNILWKNKAEIEYD